MILLDTWYGERKQNSLNYRILFSFTVMYDLVYELLRDSTYWKANDRKGKRQIPLQNETFLREWFSTFLTKRLNMLCVGCLIHPEML